jgi:transposase-like protein
MNRKKDVETTVREIRRKTRKKYSAEEKIRIVLEGLRGESTIAELCHGMDKDNQFASCARHVNRTFVRPGNHVP